MLHSVCHESGSSPSLTGSRATSSSRSQTNSLSAGLRVGLPYRDSATSEDAVSTDIIEKLSCHISTHRNTILKGTGTNIAHSRLQKKLIIMTIIIRIIRRSVVVSPAEFQRLRMSHHNVTLEVLEGSSLPALHLIWLSKLSL